MKNAVVPCSQRALTSALWSNNSRAIGAVPGDAPWEVNQSAVFPPSPLFSVELRSWTSAPRFRRNSTMFVCRFRQAHINGLNPRFSGKRTETNSGLSSIILVTSAVSPCAIASSSARISESMFLGQRPSSATRFVRVGCSALFGFFYFSLDAAIGNEPYQGYQKVNRTGNRRI